VRRASLPRRRGFAAKLRGMPRPTTRSTRPLLATAALAAAVAGCHGEPTEDGTCRCAPANRARARRPDGSTLDGATLLTSLRRHKRDVALQRPGRDVKLFDDELRLELIEFCQPCSDWVKDRLTIEEMFPLDRLDDAVAGVCMGLVLRDGTTAYGNARPRACR